MTKYYRLFICMLMLNLISCATQHQGQVNKSSLQQCQLICQQKLKSCSNECQDNCYHCSAKTCQSTAHNYSKYVHEQIIRGDIIARVLNSYRDPLQCRKISCNCSADYNTCTQNCTGVIQKQLRAVPYCA